MARKRLTEAQRVKRTRDRVEKRITKFLDRMVKKEEAARHRLQMALDQACTAMFDYDDLRMDMDDQEGDLDGLHKPVQKRFDTVFALIEKYDTQSDFYDNINTSHSKVIGVID